MSRATSALQVHVWWLGILLGDLNRIRKDLLDSTSLSIRGKRSLEEGLFLKVGILGIDEITATSCDYFGMPHV